MSRRTNLRDYQQSLLDRLQKVEHTPTSVSKLGFLVGSQRWLVDIARIEEVLPPPATTGFSLTRPWFLGIGHVRGNLMGIVDFLQFLTDSSLPRAPHNRVLVFLDAQGARYGLLVSRMLGLRRGEELRSRGELAEPSPLVRAVYDDGDGTVWNELDVDALLADRGFIDVAAV